MGVCYRTPPTMFGTFFFLVKQMLPGKYLSIYMNSRAMTPHICNSPLVGVVTISPIISGPAIDLRCRKRANVCVIGEPIMAR